MAKVALAPELISEEIFPHTDVEIVGAGWDPVRRAVVLYVEGPAVPAGAEEVIADIEPPRATFREVI